MYHLKIKNIDSGLEFELKYPGNTLLEKIFHDYSLLSNVPDDYQVWTGWPKHFQSSKSISDMGIEASSVHLLQVYDARRRRSASHPTLVQSPDAVFEMNDNAFDMTGAAAAENQPDNANEIALVKAFVSSFSTKYCEASSSLFYPGSLSSAAGLAWDCDLRQRRPLAIYVHYADSPFSDIFCRQILCDTAPNQFLKENFVTWPWDLSRWESRQTLHQIFAFVFKFATIIEQLLAALTSDKLPKLMLLNRLTSSIEILGELGPPCNIGEAMDVLLAAHDCFMTDIKSKVDSAAREADRQELQRAYLESLEHDRKKEQFRLELQKNEQKESSVKESNPDSIALQHLDLSPEPPMPVLPSQRNRITTLRFRTPSGRNVTRRFRADDRLHHLLTFCSSLGYPSSRFKIITSFPRRELTQLLDMELTLSDLNLVPQETLTLEEKD